MRRLLYGLMLVELACLLAGIYGILYNQIVYTISPEFFTRLKFLEFIAKINQQERIEVARWGFLNFWHIGLYIGVAVVPFGLVFKENKQFLIKTLKAFALIALITWIVSFIGLVLSFFVIDVRSPLNHRLIVGHINENIEFARVCLINDFSFYGGFTGGFFAILYLLFTRFSIKKLLSRIFKKRDSILRIFIVVCSVRILCYLYFLYYAVNYINYLWKNRNAPYITTNDVILFIIYSLSLVFLLFLEIVCIKRIRSDIKPFKKFLYISSIFSLAVCIYLINHFIRSFIMIRNSMRFRGSSVWSFYRFSISHVVVLIIFTSAVFLLLLLIKYRKKLVKHSIEVAEPVFMDGNCNNTLTNG